MDKNQLARRVAEMRKSLFDEGDVDEYQLNEVERMSGDAEKVMTAFFDSKAPNILRSIEPLVICRAPDDYTGMINKIDDLVRNSSAVGAPKVTNKCFKFIDYCENQHAPGCYWTLREIKQELAELKEKLNAYFQLEREFRNA